VLGSLFLTTGDTSYIPITILNGGNIGQSVVSFVNGEDSTAVVTGFTIQGSNFAEYGGGIRCIGSSPIITYNIIRDNEVEENHHGGGIYCSFASPLISHNKIYNNNADVGGGIACYGESSPKILYNYIHSNVSSIGGGINCYEDAEPEISNNIITGNTALYGGGIWLEDVNIQEFNNNTLSGNFALLGGGIYCTGSTGNINATNTILWSDSAYNEGNEIYLDSGGSINIEYCNIQNTLWPGTGNISCDPMFCDPDSGDFYLEGHSCCEGSGEGGVDIGALGVGCITPITIHVPADYSTIQRAIDYSYHGDTVLVQPGTYVENINFHGNAIIVGSLFLTTGDTTYISSTIIDGGSSTTVVKFDSQEDNTSIITGFTITNGQAGVGGGISCGFISSPTISFNRIISNYAGSAGGGIFCYYSSPIISDNIISGNISEEYGGGIFCDFFASPTITNNVIVNNSASEGGGLGFSDFTELGYSHNNTICQNIAQDNGGGIYCSNDSFILFRNSVLWGNTAGDDGDQLYSRLYGTISLGFCDIQDTLWPGNISCDPMFCDPGNGNFYLADTSCCVGTGEDGVDIGAYGIGCGNEGYEYLSGDANMAAGLWPPAVIGADVTYLVNYFRGQAESCLIDGFYVSGDANGDCSVIGSDVTYLVNYFRGLNEIHYCPDYEPVWPPVPDDAPAGWPNCE